MRPYSIFPTTKIQLRLANEAITSKYKECLRTAYLTQDLYEYYQSKFEWDASVIDDIWWDSFGACIKRLSHSDRQKIQKFHVRRLHTNNRRQMFNQSSSALCPYCATSIEHNDHIIQCMQCSPDRLSVKEEWKLKLHDFLSNDHTPVDVKTVILVAVNCWINNEPIPMAQAILPTIDVTLSRAYSSQSQIGWDNFVRGKLSIWWEAIISAHLTKYNIEAREMTADRWATSLISELWHGVLGLWDARNREVYGHDTATQVSKLKALLLQEARDLLDKRDHCQSISVPWLDKPIEELIQY